MITLMKESGNLPEILTSHMRGLAKDAEPSRLNIICWIKTSMAFRMAVKMMDAEPMLLKQKFPFCCSWVCFDCELDRDFEVIETYY